MFPVEASAKAPSMIHPLRSEGVEYNIVHISVYNSGRDISEINTRMVSRPEDLETKVQDVQPDHPRSQAAAASVVLEPMRS